MEDEIGDKGHAGNLITHVMDSEYSNSTIHLQKIKLLSRSKGAMLNSRAPHIAVCEVILGLFFFFLEWRGYLFWGNVLFLNRTDALCNYLI